MAKQIRILVETPIDGIPYAPDTVVEIDDKTAKSLCQSGTADAAPEAVDYCVSTLGAKVVKHGQAAKAGAEPTGDATATQNPAAQQ